MIPDDDRSVSIAITHALTIAISAVLISALLISAGNLLQKQEERVAQDQFNDIGADIVTHINSLDRLNATGKDANASVTPEYPNEVAGETYTIELSGGSKNPFGTEFALNISSPVYSRTIQYPLDTRHTDLEAGTTAQGSDPTITLCDQGTIVLGGGSECP